MPGRSDRAFVFVDGSNWYFGCASLGLADLGQLNFAKVSRKLVGPREWVAIRYYVGEVLAARNPRLADSQLRFLEFQAQCDPRFSHHFGRLEPRIVVSKAAPGLNRYLGSLRTPIDRTVFKELQALAKARAVKTVLVEKAVDVHLAVDMVVMAERGQFEAAHLLSADGDLTPAVRAVRETGRKVFVASPVPGAQLAGACDTFIRLRASWFVDVFGA